MAASETTNVFLRTINLVRRSWKAEAERRHYKRLRKQYEPGESTETIDWRWSDIRYNRLAVLTTLAARKPEGAYLEIGCFKNEAFDAIAMATKVGVDPERGGTVRATSDDFFKSNTQTFDIVFIDGLHTYEQVHRDVANALKVLRPDGWIVMHDMLPRNWVEQHSPMVHLGAWPGDTWKVGFELLQSPGVDFRILTIDFGVGVVHVREPGVELAELSDTLTDAPFEYFYKNRDRLPLATWEEALPWLRTS